MIASTNREYCLLNYVPNVLSDKSASIAMVIFPGDPEKGVCAMIYTADWQTRVRVLDRDADLEALEALLSDIRDRLLSPSQCSSMIHQLEDSFSNIIQVSQRRECTLEVCLEQKASKLTPGPSSAQVTKPEASDRTTLALDSIG